MVISDNRMIDINVPGYVQFSLLLIVIGTAIWFPYSAGRVAGYGVKSENELVLIENYDNVEYRVQQIERNLNSLEQYMKALNSTGLTVKDKKSAEKPRADLKKKYKDKLSMLEDKQYYLVANFYNSSANRIKTLESVLSALKVDYSSAALSAGIQNRSVGGPYIPLEQPSEEDRNYFLGEEFVENFKYLYYLKKITAALPIMSPLDSPRVTSKYGARRDPFRRTLSSHSGIDLVSDVDPSVYSTASGVVTFSGRNGAYGNMIKIKHDNGLETRYAHLKITNVYKGQKVNRGDVIGIQGSSGRSTGTHLHYEIRKDGRHINPAQFLKQAHKINFHAL